jgi:hypothetical protein
MLIFGVSIFAQTEINAKGAVITYKKGMHNIKYGENLILKIENTNPFINKTFSTIKSIDYDFSSAEFQKISLELDGKKIENEIANVVTDSNNSNNSNVKMKIESLKFAQANYNRTSTYKKNLTFNNNLKEIDSLSSEIKKEIDSLNSELITQRAEIEKYINQIKSLENLNKEQKEQIIKLTEINTAKNEFLQNFKEFQISFDKINNYLSINELLINQIKESSTFVNDTSAFKQKARTTLQSIGLEDVTKTKQDIVKQIEKIGSLYSDLNANYQKINEILKKRDFVFKGDLKDGKNTLSITNMTASFDLKYYFEDEMKKVKAINDSITLPKNKRNIINETFKGCDLFTEIIHHDYITKVSSEFVYNDKADIIFLIKNDKNEILHTYPTIKVKTYNQIKINGSAGYFLNFIGDESFETYQKPNDQNNYLRASNKNTIKHALGGLLHAYYNFTPSFASGLSVGLSLNDDSNASFYTGVSFFLTESNRLVITSGVSFVKVDKLKTANLYTDASNNFFYTNPNYQIQYEKVYKPSCFIGITYNLF